MRKAYVAIFSGLILTGIGISFSAGAAESTTATPVAQPINYEGNDGQLVCHHIVHEGQLTAASECHTQAGWDRLRHEFTQRSLDGIQRHGLLQLNR